MSSTTLVAGDNDRGAYAIESFALSDQNQASIPTNLRLLLLLEMITRDRRGISASELADALNLPKPTIHRLLQTAIKEKLIQKGLDGRYHGLGSRLLRLAEQTTSDGVMRSERLAVLRRVAKELGETCNLAMSSGEGMIYFDRVETDWPICIQIPIGSQVPFHCTASGKIFLSTLPDDLLNAVVSNINLEKNTSKSITSQRKLLQELDQVRERNYAMEDEEFLSNMTAIAVPIYYKQDKFIASLSIHAPAQRYPAAELPNCLPVLEQAAKELAAIYEG